ncbi:hypothetical protein D3C76_1222440 [compost metagenome]
MTYRNQPFIEQLEALDVSRETAIGEQDRAIVGLRVEVHGVDIHPHARQLHAAVVIDLLEAVQRPEQPTHRQRGGGLEAQAIAILAQQRTGILDDLEADLELLGQQAAVLGEAQLRATALEKVAAEQGFEGLDVVADRTLGQRQLFSGAGERSVARGHFEGAQRVQSLNPFRHGTSQSMSETNSRS